MGRALDAFVLFAEMRTGSNHLEESLNALDDVRCHGELFNPTFIGQQNRFEFLGFDMARRDRDPVSLIDRMIGDGGPLPGFRFFHDHDPRVLDRVLPDPRIAKVLLTRNPLDSYVSRKIASATGQWRLTDLKHAKSGRIVFDAAEFAGMLDDWAAFRAVLRRGLQVTGQTAFHIRYEDINDVDVLNGLAAHLGSEHRLAKVSRRLKRQNPGAIEDKVENPAEMAAALARIDRFGLDRVEDGEVPRAPGVPGFVAHPGAGLLFLPVAGAPSGSVLDWLAGIGGVGHGALLTGFTQKDLRAWMREHPGFATFTVVRHPARRLVSAYVALRDAPDDRSVDAREVMSARYGVPFDPGAPPTDATLRAFAEVLKGCLEGQTNLRVRPEWATQTAILQAAATVALPHRVFREDEAAAALRGLVETQGVDAPAYCPETGPKTAPGAAGADASAAFGKAVFDTYRKDFIQFGFAPSAAP